jgi:large conductance mechanosensitive channel
MSVFKEFREFAMRGSVVDLAIGVIIGAAFNGVVQSLVNDVVMPPIGLATGGLDFSAQAIVLRPASIGPDGAEVAATAISYGKFLNTIISFVIVAWVLFLVVKGMNTMRKKEAQKPADPPAPTPEEKLLVEIRDLLKAR